MVHLATAALPIRVLVQLDRPPEVTIRAWRDITRSSHAEMAERWYTEFMPLHFRQDAAAKYGYQPRSAKYLKRKQQRGSAGIARTGIEAGGRLPLVYTGLLRRSARAFVQIRGFPTRGVVTMALPAYATIKPYQSGRPNLAKELTTVTRGEQFVLSTSLQTSIVNRLSRLRAPRTYRSS